MTQAAETGAPEETVFLTVPANPAYVSVLRTVTASLAARRDFTIEEIDDLRIAVDEASALLLPHAGSGESLSASFGGATNTLTIEVSVPLTAGDDTKPDEDGFAWMVLSALADTVTTDATGDRLVLTLTKARSARST
ncbi:MAG TPA: ATP-binding protein [Jatrophihabitans sp.]|nr:ATP-binding protein [Jatrophihabitans sp.]